MISPSVLIAAGYDPSPPDDRVFVTTASAIVYLPKIRIDALEAIGTSRPLVVLATSLPPSAGVDGLLGLDFFRDRKLTIGFRKGRIDLV